MADAAYSYVLVVEFGENGNTKLKNKLVKYFQSKKSNGGDCKIQYESPHRTATLRFRTEEARQKVLEKKTHEVILNDERVLKITVRLPSEQGTPVDRAKMKSDLSVSADVTATDETHRGSCAPEAGFEMKVVGTEYPMDEEPCSCSAVLGNIPEDIPNILQFLELLVETISQRSSCPAVSEDFSLEILPDNCSAVVTFHSRKENTAFIASCPRNKTFNNKGISVRSLEVTTKVRIEDISNLGQDHLHLYFDTEGMDVESVLLSDEEQCAIITFTNPKAVHRVIEKKHFIKKKHIKVFPFYESLGMALYGKDRPTLKLPAAFSESVDPAICRCLHDKHEVAEKIHKDLEKYFCKVDFQQSAVCLSPLPSLLQQKGVKAKDITDWARAAKTAFAHALSKFKSLQFQVESSAWEESEREIREALLTEAVVVVADEDNGALSVAGLGDDLNRLETPLRDMLNGIAKRVQRKNSGKTEEFKLSPSTYHILLQNGLQDQILHEYPEVIMSYNKERQTFVSSGLTEEVCGATRKMMGGVLALKRQMLEVDDFVLEFLKGEDQERLTSSLLTSKGIHAVLEITENAVQLLAASDNVLNDAKDELKTLLISQYIHLEDNSIMKMSEWQDLLTDLEDATNNSFRKIQISATVPGQKVVVSGYKDDVESIHNKLKDFLQQNGKVEEVIVVTPDTIVNYIEQYKQHAWLNQVKDGVVVSFNNEAICLSGSRANVTAHKDLINQVVSSVVLDTLKVSKPGAKKFFQDQETTYVSSVMASTGCLVQLVDELDLSLGRLDQAQDLSPGPKIPKLAYQLQTTDGVEVAVCKADLCSYPVDAVVNASNEDFDHGAGLAAALLNAAGPQLQKELDKLKIQGGRLKPGDCAVTGAGGQLSCKLIIHAVGPHYNQADSQKAVGQLIRAVKRSLELAELHGCPSVALPAISRNLGFPLDLCADTIVKAVKDHCEDHYGENTLKRIHLVDGEDGAVLAMEAAVRKVFGNQGISHSQQNHPTDTTQSQHVRTAQRQANSDQVLTKEGLCITLKKGNIEDATTQVVVNTVGENLNLNAGVVSKAILRAAGNKLQDLINKKQTVGKAGDVIITDGCQLCDKVFHAIAPQWDKGQGTAEKMLSGIVRCCLNQAEDSGLASMTFPAIGTGNLAFPKDLVASLVLGEVLTFSSNKQPKTLQEVVFILHPSDTQTIQAFRDEFKKRFTASGGSAPTTATQSKGPFSKITSSSGMHETQMGNVVIQVAMGDITKETSDVIVNSSNETFTLKTGVSKAILDAAGQSVEVECQQLGSEPNPGMILTKPGNLKCKRILHLTGKNDPSSITVAVTEALEMCVAHSYTSVSFPAIGTGQGSTKASLAADAMLDAVVDVVSQNTQSLLRTVRIIIFQPAMLNDFYSSMQKKEDVDPQDVHGFWGNLGSQIKSFFTGGSATASKPPKNQAFVFVSQKVDPACFHICGDTRAKVDSAKKWIGDLLNKSQGRKDFTDLSDSDLQRIVDIQATMNVRIEYNQHQALLTIEGLHMDVLNATTVIDAMLKRAREEEQFQKNVEQAGSVADWQYGAQGLQFQSFDPITNYQLEEGLKKHQPFVEVFMQGQVYKVELPEGPAIDDQGNSFKVNRIDKLAMFCLPTTWEDMPADTIFKSFPILPGSAEYNKVLSQFQASSKGTVVKIERIQNPSMWQSLQVKKQDMEGRNHHNNNAKLLFHGTCQTNVDRINDTGFNRNYDGQKDDLWKGTRFTVNAATSEIYSKPDTQGQKCMYLCHVLTGDYTLRQPNMITPPAKSSNANHLYDSVVDDMNTPNMFMVFHDQMAYPEYLITFQ